MTSNKGFLTQFYPDSSRTFKGECTRGDFFFREEKRLVKDREKKGKRKREWKRIALVRVLGDESHQVCNNFVADRSTTERRLFFADIYLFLFFFFMHQGWIPPFFIPASNWRQSWRSLFCFFFFFFPMIGHVLFNTFIESSRERGSSLGTSSPPPFEFRMPRF